MKSIVVAVIATLCVMLPMKSDGSVCGGPAEGDEPFTGDLTFSITVEGTQRRYVVHVPEGYTSERRWPVVIMFHGGGGNARAAMRETRWTETADREGFLAVFPEGTPRDPSRRASFLGNPQTWNDGSRRSNLGAVQQQVPDVKYTAAMLSDLDRRFRLDKRRIYATGFSNGASMTFRLARELSAVWAAVAPVAGSDWMPETVPKRAVPLLYITGTADPLNPIDGGEIRIGRKSYGTKPSTEDMIDAWIHIHGCRTSPVIIHDSANARIAAFTHADGSKAVLLCTLDGHGHHWPGGRSLLPAFLAGEDKSPIDATEVIWGFFRSQVLPERKYSIPREEGKEEWKQ